MNIKSNEELLQAFQELLPQPEKHYPVQADWKDWINLEHWLKETLKAKDTEADKRVAEAYGEGYKQGKFDAEMAALNPKDPTPDPTKVSADTLEDHIEKGREMMARLSPKDPESN